MVKQVKVNLEAEDEDDVPEEAPRTEPPTVAPVKAAADLFFLTAEGLDEHWQFTGDADAVREYRDAFYVEMLDRGMKPRPQRGSYGDKGGTAKPAGKPYGQKSYGGGGGKAPKCAVCKKEINGFNGTNGFVSAQQAAQSREQKYGKPLCGYCVRKVKDGELDLEDDSDE